MAEQLISTAVHDELPESYVRPEWQRPRLGEVVSDAQIPVVDLADPDPAAVVARIGEACATHGFFQVLNHGVPAELMGAMLAVAYDFFWLPPEEKAKLYSDDPAKKMRLSTSFNVRKETVHNWRDYLRLHCHPLDKYAPDWPASPPSFSSWVMTWVGLVKKIRNATQLISLRLGELVAEPHIKCPKCECDIDISNVSLVWPPLPAGVKFDPSDLELLQHLQGKSCLPNSSSPAIDEFIPTIEETEGICYTHPQNLPGIKMDGSSIHFFHRVSNAYGCGQRKRRKISDGDDVSDEHIRWHKTGNSKVICDENGANIGWKKILVLYSGSKRGGGGKIHKNRWVMHQYHLGLDENEMNGEFVVSKIFYQSSSKKNGKPETCDVVLESDAQIEPTTVKADPHQPLHPNNSSCLTEQYTPAQVDQGGENCGTSIYRVKEEGAGSPACFDGPQAVMNADLAASNEPVQPRDVPDAGLEALYSELPELDPQYLGAPSGLSTSLADMPLGSPDSLWGWMWPDIC